MSSSAARMKNRGPANASLLSSWSRMTWQTFWHRKHSMHLRNSCDALDVDLLHPVLAGRQPGGGANAGICRAFS